MSIKIVLIGLLSLCLMTGCVAGTDCYAPSEEDVHVDSTEPGYEEGERIIAVDIFTAIMSGIIMGPIGSGIIYSIYHFFG